MVRVVAIIPALNEADNIGRVIADISTKWVQAIIVTDNGSTDATADVARLAGATVLYEPKRGYGAACLKAIAYLQALPTAMQPQIVVFLDADYADYPQEIPLLLYPILYEGYSLVIGSRTRGTCERGALSLPQRWGNSLATFLLYRLFRVRFTDLGPFRAIAWTDLQQLDMRDTTFGWTVEMQAKAAKLALPCTEIAVRYRRRYRGQSKVSGTLRGIVLAGTKILWTIFKVWRS